MYVALFLYIKRTRQNKFSSALHIDTVSLPEQNCSVSIYIVDLNFRRLDGRRGTLGQISHFLIFVNGDFE